MINNKSTFETKDPANKWKKLMRSPKNLYKTYKNNAKRRGLAFELDYERFSKIVKCECMYCGKGVTMDFPFNGIDRIDNTKGYLLDNSVSCCSRCNILKSNLDLRDFLNHIYRIIVHCSMNNWYGLR